ncbi:MAG: rRNA maturation RNase YbeY [candidate division WOR-3 bacterium]|nr:rRNA maturation RNase YbeY [candidate division WOR-3 bacterium]
MKIWINNLPEYEDKIREIARKVIEGEGLKGELSITFIDDDQMIELNEKYTTRRGTTDVLSFPFDISELLGDIYISVSQAKRQKEGSLLSELKLLTVHGILHLSGYDDRTEEDRKEMGKKEQEYLSE